MWVHNAHAQGGVRFWKQDIQNMRGLGEDNRIRLATLNIRSGRAGGMETVLRR